LPSIVIGRNFAKAYEVLHLDLPENLQETSPLITVDTDLPTTSKPTNAVRTDTSYTLLTSASPRLRKSRAYKERLEALRNSAASFGILPTDSIQLPGKSLPIQPVCSLPSEFSQNPTEFICEPNLPSSDPPCETPSIITNNSILLKHIEPSLNPALIRIVEKAANESVLHPLLLSILEEQKRHHETVERILCNSNIFLTAIANNK
jgi:hypothetical protein